MASTHKIKQDEDREPPTPHIQAGGQYENDVYFMAVALLIAKKSQDPNTKVGTCIVNQEGNIVGVGYNCMPNGCKFPWKREAENKLDEKYPYVCHAVLNAIMNKTSMDVKGCTIYTTLFPCNECAKLIIQSGIGDMIYLSDKNVDTEETEASRRILNAAGIAHRQFQSKEEVKVLLRSIDPFAE